MLRHGVGGAGALAQLQLGRGGHSVLVTGILSEVWTASGVLFESPPTVAAIALLGPHLRPPQFASAPLGGVFSQEPAALDPVPCCGVE